MEHKIQNLTNRPVLFRLNSGETLHLAPRATSDRIMDVELGNNLKIQKLKDRHVIALCDAEKKKTSSEGSSKKKSKSKKVKK